MYVCVCALVTLKPKPPYLSKAPGFPSELVIPLLPTTATVMWLMCTFYRMWKRKIQVDSQSEIKDEQETLKCQLYFTDFEKEFVSVCVVAFVVVWLQVSNLIAE